MLSPQSESRAYLTALAALAMAGGVQGVLFPYLITVELAKPPEWVGFAQMAAMLPTLIFILPGGAVADHFEHRRLILTVTALGLLPITVLATLIGFEALSYWPLVAFAFAMATIGSFSMPARDAAVPDIAAHEGRPLAHLVSAATATQFAAQIAGNIVAGFASYTGALVVVIVQGVATLAALFFFARLKPQRPHAHAPPIGGLAGIIEALVEAARNPRMAPVLVNIFLSGILFMGVWVVTLPLMLRDLYGGGSQELAIISIAFMTGASASGFLQTRLPPVKRQGRFVMLAGLGSWLSLVGFALHPPLWAIYALMLWWGICAGSSMATSRTLIMGSASAAMRARLSAIYTLSQMGGGPIGALLMGFLIARLGLLPSLLVPIGLVLIMFLVMRFATPLWHTATDHGADGSNP